MLKASTSTAIGEADLAKYRADIEKIVNDIQTVTSRIHEARGEPIPASAGASSPFVSGLRALTETGRGPQDAKLSNLQALLDKVCEYDRIILSKTAPPETSASGVPLRRKSIGADLFSLPSHLRIVDRLLDLYNQSKRVAVIRTTISSNNAEEGKSGGTDADLEASKADKALIESLKSSLAKLTQRADESDKKRIAMETESTKSQMIANQLRKELEEYKEKLASKERDFNRLQEQFDNLTTEKQNREESTQNLLEKLDTANQENAMLQRRLESEASVLQAVLRTMLQKASYLRQKQFHSEYGHLVSISFSFI
jgi:hypothetical protein